MVRVSNVFVALMFAAFLSSARGQCDNSDFEYYYTYDNYGGKSLEYRSEYSPEVAPVCYMLYEQLEQSLFNDHLNLYKLRRVFFPNAKVNPIVVAIMYNISFQNITDELCPGVNLKKNNTVNILNGTDNAAANFSANIIWTSSVAFSVLHPDVINWLLPSLIYLLGPIRGSYFNISDNSADIHLFLEVGFLQCIPSVHQVLDALHDLTTMLKVFAEAQEQVSSSDSKYKGYTVQGNAKSLAYGSFYFPTLVLLIVLWLLYTRLIITKWASGYLKKLTAKEKPYYQLFVSVYFVTVLVCYIFIGVEVMGLVIWVINVKSSIATVVSKLSVFLFFCIIINSIPAYFIAQNSTDLRDLSIVVEVSVFAFSCGCFCCCCYTEKVVKYLLAWSFLIFTSILLWSFIPTVILAFVNPIQTLAVVLLVFSIFFLACTSLALSCTYFATEDEDREGQMRCCRICLTVLISIGFGIILLFVLALAVYLIHKGVSTGGILGFVLAFVPGIITGTVAWFTRKLLLQYKDKQVNALGTQADEERGELQRLVNGSNENLT